MSHIFIFAVPILLILRWFLDYSNDCIHFCLTLSGSFIVGPIEIVFLENLMRLWWPVMVISSEWIIEHKNTAVRSSFYSTTEEIVKGMGFYPDCNGINPLFSIFHQSLFLSEHLPFSLLELFCPPVKLTQSVCHCCHLHSNFESIQSNSGKRVNGPEKQHLKLHCQFTSTFFSVLFIIPPKSHELRQTIAQPPHSIGSCHWQWPLDGVLGDGERAAVQSWFWFSFVCVCVSRWLASSCCIQRECCFATWV